MADDAYAGRLAAVAIDLAVRMRDDDPEAVDRWLRSTLDDQERHDLLYILAAALPIDVPWSALTAWVRAGARALHPCGTSPAASRHRARREPLDPACLAAESARRQRHRARRALESANG